MKTYRPANGDINSRDQLLLSQYVASMCITYSPGLLAGKDSEYRVCKKTCTIGKLMMLASESQGAELTSVNHGV